ncbi:MAG: nucleotide sugar dehydrogenase, partial [Firmicutes bacterium]|nr:nucleotide sugar dehydrogenase [Bacillota bacterium]
MKILICGAGYVGLSNALLMSTKHQVFLFDINEKKRESIRKLDFTCLNELNLGRFPIIYNNIQLVDTISRYKFDFVIIALPTDLGDDGKLSIDVILDCLKELNKETILIVKSTLPLGASKLIIDKFGDFIYIPEFQREGTAVYDSFYPSRIVISGDLQQVNEVKNLYSECILNQPEIILTNHIEAECIKLFSNTYLAMRVAFFNELDTYMMQNQINVETVIHGMGLDERIGLHYNNPSFGFGGYCLPKDTEEVKNSIDSILIENINKSNINRTFEIAQFLSGKGYRKIGIYKLASKSRVSSNRNSATILLIEELKKTNVELFVYDQNEVNIAGCTSVNDLEELFRLSDIVIANRVEKELEKYKDKVFS